MLYYYYYYCYNYIYDVVIDDKNFYCWDKAFQIEYKSVKLFVKLITTNESATNNVSSSPLSISILSSSKLHIQGIGHTLNVHIILDHLETITIITQCILKEIKGLGNIQITSTCPECLMIQKQDSDKGTFKYEDIFHLQEWVYKLDRILSNKTQIRNDLELTEALRALHDKRYICTKNQCRIQSNRLVFLPRNVREGITNTSKTEQSIQFLLDECVRASSISSNIVQKSVVRILSAKINKITLNTIKEYLHKNQIYRNNMTKYSIIPSDFSSGVLVDFPIHNNTTSTAATTTSNSSSSSTNNTTTTSLTMMKYNVLKIILTCEHLVTDIKVENDKFIYKAKNNRPTLENIFLIGGI